MRRIALRGMPDIKLYIKNYILLFLLICFSLLSLADACKSCKKKQNREPRRRTEPPPPLEEPECYAHARDCKHRIYCQRQSPEQKKRNKNPCNNCEICKGYPRREPNWTVNGPRRSSPNDRYESQSKILFYERPNKVTG